VLSRNGAHNGGREWSDRHSHAEAEDQDTRKECAPIGAPFRRDREGSKAACRDQRAEDQERTHSPARGEAARPAAHRRHEEDEWNERSSGRRGAVTLYLNEIERDEEESTAEGGVEAECQQVGAGKRALAKERERHHRCGMLRLSHHERDQRGDTDDKQEWPGFEERVNHEA
jgi:hypothetical protein